ncbi:MAG: hypothetical protein IJV13_03775 [Prevotella sp.]|nr:hypothetical protein [Prevotella sp.]
MKKYDAPTIKEFFITASSLICATVLNSSLSNETQDNNDALSEEYRIVNHHGLDNNWDIEEEE